MCIHSPPDLASFLTSLAGELPVVRTCLLVTKLLLVTLRIESNLSNKDTKETGIRVRITEVYVLQRWSFYEFDLFRTIVMSARGGSTVLALKRLLGEKSMDSGKILI